MNPKINVKLKDEKNQYVKVLIEDRLGNKKYIDMHGYLVGIEAALAFKKQNKFHNLVIITGGVGTGKSTLVKGLGALGSKAVKQNFGFDNISWATEKFIEKTDRDDNIASEQIWDESIQGATGRNMAITNIGNKLKMAFVTKRFKIHTYYLLIDEINEYAWKLIKMADCWINVRKFYIQRGYFDCYCNPKKIKFIYNAFKYYNKTWDNWEIKKINPDCKGKFMDFSDMFVDEAEYDRLKLEETKQIEENININWKPQKVKAFYYWSKGGNTHKKIAENVGVARQTIGTWISDFEKAASYQIP